MSNVRKRKRGSALAEIDHSITAETRQPTFDGNPCKRCGSTLRLKAGNRCVRCLRQWRRDNEWRYYRQHGSALFRKLGITPAEFYAMAEAQGWACKICHQIPTSMLHVDHDHETNKIRGLLCGGCNVGLGHFGDSAERLKAAAEYLEANA
jgi:hypothetical protein